MITIDDSSGDVVRPDVAGPGGPDRREGATGGHGLDELFPRLYDELCRLAHYHRRTWNGNDTLNTQALVHEAYLKLAPRSDGAWASEAHFLAVAGRAIRHILVNYARDRAAIKRGGAWQRVALDPSKPVAASQEADLEWGDRVLELEEALVMLAARSERQCRIVECRFFAGMTLQQTADALGVSVPTVSRGWAMAKAWLHCEMSGGEDARVS
jgi:RNA polymerase sigma factor (TIGR02999 family)